MSDAINREVYDRLTVEQKMQLADEIWADIDRMSGEAPLPPDLAEIAEQRLRAYEADPTAVVSWEDLKRELLGEK